MSKILIFFNLILMASPAFSKGVMLNKATPQVSSLRTAPISSFRSYREWKTEQLAFWHFRGQAEMAKDLTVADYFAGYLTKQKNQVQAIKEVSGRLSADEVAELMTIYANSVFGTHSPSTPLYGEIKDK